MERFEFEKATLPPLIDPTVAYVKAVTIEGVKAYAIFLADGTSAAPFSTALRSGTPSFGCRMAAACSSSPASPTS